MAQLGKAEHLKSAAVGEDGAVPAGKLVQAAHIGNDLITGTQVEMIGVAPVSYTHLLAKVEVASSSLVGRSRQTAKNRFTPAFCLLW